MDALTSLNNSIFSALAQDRDLDAMLVGAEQACGCPCAVFDMHMNCIGCSPGAKALFIASDVLELLPDWVRSIRRTELRCFLAGELCGTIRCPDGRLMLLQCSVRTGITHSVIAVSSDELHLKTAEQAAKLISRVYGAYYLNGREAALGVDSLRSGLANALLHEGKRGDGLFSSVYGVDYPGVFDLHGRYIMLDIHTTGPRAPLSTLRKTSELLEHSFPDAYSVITSGTVSAIICRLGEDIEPLYSVLDEFMRQHSLCCGVSLPFRDLSQRYKFKHQAHIAWELTNERVSAAGLRRSDELISEIIMHEICEMLSADAFILSDILLLAKQDEEKHTNLLQTLSVWLDNNCRISATARQLFLDRSTLKYRLQKIQDMLSFDLDNENSILALKLSLLAWKLSEGNAPG